jgi:hypothetical protein
VIENTVTAFTNIQGDQNTQVSVYNAGTPTVHLAVLTEATLTYCYDRASTASFLRAWTDAAGRADAVLPVRAEPIAESRLEDHSVAAIARARDTLTHRVYSVGADIARTGRPHLVVQVGHTVTHAYDQVAVHATHAIWTLAEQFAAQIFSDSPDAIEVKQRRAARRAATLFERTRQTT